MNEVRPYSHESLPWLVEVIFLSQYLCIAISQYCVQKFLVWIRPKAQFTHNIFAHNIEIKRYCNKRKMTFFLHFFSCVNWKYLFLHNYAYWNQVWKYFKMPLQYFYKKCLFIFLSQYLFIAKLCAKISRVNKALDRGISEWICPKMASVSQFIKYCSKKNFKTKMSSQSDTDNLNQFKVN